MQRNQRCSLFAPLEGRLGFVISLGVRWGERGGGAWPGTTRSEGDPTGLTWVTPQGARGRLRAHRGPQMTVGTLPPLLLRLVFFRDRLGVAMSAKRSSGQPYCRRTSVHSWLEACRA